MKNLLRKVFSPILNALESGEEAFQYKRSQRIILIVVGILFCALGTAVFFVALGKDLGYMLPVVVFGGAGAVSLIVGSLGNDRAVAKIWGTKEPLKNAK